MSTDDWTTQQMQTLLAKVLELLSRAELVCVMWSEADRWRTIDMGWAACEERCGECANCKLDAIRKVHCQ